MRRESEYRSVGEIDADNQRSACVCDERICA